MPLTPTDEYARESIDPGSFLRTARDPAVIARTADGPGTVTPPGLAMRPFYPYPDPDETIIARLEGWENFTVVAVRTDPPADTAPDGALQTALTRCLESIARPCGALWFEWNPGLYGCIVPDTAPPAAEALARQIQSALAESRVETVSIGVSSFPLLDFDRAAALHNACKALDHAAFFGPAAMVTFDAVSLNISGDHCYQSGDNEAAIAEYRAALRLDAQNLNVQNSLGVCLAQKGELSEARTLFETARRIDPGEAMAVYNLGVLHLLENRKDLALACFRQAFAVDAGTFEISFQIGKLLIEDNAYADALRFLEKAVALNDTCAAAHCLAGRCLARLERSEDAIAAYKRAIKINPNDAAALAALGTLYDAKGENPDICFTFCRQSVAVAPENGLFRLHLARLYRKHNQLTNALSEYETAAALGCDARRQIAEIQELLEADEGNRQCCA